MIGIGQYNTLKALRLTPQGMYLGQEGEKETVLLPNRYLPEDLEVDQEVKVFIYKDSEDRLIATTQEPLIKLHEFACLQVVDINRKGAFLDWGLEKDLMVPYSEQDRNMREGEYYLVYLFLDNLTHRLIATTRINRYLEKGKITVKPGDKVDLVIGPSTENGVNVIINNKYKGLIYHNEIFREIHPGERTEGYIKEVREDGKIDVSLQQQGYENTFAGADALLQMLQDEGGFLPLHDQSAPEDIKEQAGMSKKTFKKAVGLLYKQRLITIEDKGIRLTKEGRDFKP